MNRVTFGRQRPIQLTLASPKNTTLVTEAEPIIIVFYYQGGRIRVTLPLDDFQVS